MTVITLTTDYGISSPSVGLLNGVIWRSAPGAQIVELTHDIPRGDLISAQVVLENAIPYFPDGTIHLAATLPEAGEKHRPIVAQLGPMQFVGPDNGLITPLLELAEANRWPVEVYHAAGLAGFAEIEAEPLRAVYAPLAAALASGVPLGELGERISDPVRASIPAPEMLADGWRGQVVQIDHFGNLAVNIKRAHLEGMGAVQITAGGLAVGGLSRTFGDGQPGDLIAMIDSSNRLSICVVNGSAAEQFNLHTGDLVEVRAVPK